MLVVTRVSVVAVRGASVVAVRVVMSLGMTEDLVFVSGTGLLVPGGRGTGVTRGVPVSSVSSLVSHP